MHLAQAVVNKKISLAESFFSNIQVRRIWWRNTLILDKVHDVAPFAVRFVFLGIKLTLERGCEWSRLSHLKQKVHQ